MNLQRVESYTRELASLVSACEQIQAKIDQAQAQLDLCRQDNDRDTARKIEQFLGQARTELTTTTKAACEKAGRDSFDRAQELVIDLMVRIEAAHEERKAFRRNVAEFEFSVAHGVEIDRPMEEARLDDSRARVETRVAEAARLVPNRPVLLRP